MDIALVYIGWKFTAKISYFIQMQWGVLQRWSYVRQEWK